MSNSPEEIRRDIERTRADLSGNVNALAEGANPANVARRQVDKVKERATDLKSRIFGDPDDPYDHGAVGGVQHDLQHRVGDVQDRAASVMDDARTAVQDAPRQLRRQAQGNPLAAGLIAFGVGALIGGLLPSTRAEQDLAATAREKAEPLMEEAREMAKGAAEHLQPAAQEALDEVRGVVTTAGEHVRDQAQGAVQDVKDQTQSSTEEVKGDDRNPL